eukprot:2663570-Rhodomonas_salina.1
MQSGGRAAPWVVGGKQRDNEHSGVQGFLQVRDQCQSLTSFKRVVPEGYTRSKTGIHHLSETVNAQSRDYVT